MRLSIREIRKLAYGRAEVAGSDVFALLAADLFVPREGLSIVFQSK
jgi:hypothetical protein